MVSKLNATGAIRYFYGSIYDSKLSKPALS